MKFPYTISLLVSLFALIQDISASPTCDDVSKYSTDWFLAHTKPEWSSSYFYPTALFYTAGLSERAKQYAKKSGSKKVTIWEIWPCELYRHHSTRSNSLSCIMSNSRDRLTYFENMSRAFAMKAHKVALAMHRDIDSPPKDTIWGRVELPVLRDSGMVNWITNIDVEDTGKWNLEWKRPVQMMQDEVEKVMQMILSSGREELKRRDEESAGDVCELRVDSSHPLY